MVGRRCVLKAHTSFSLGFSWAKADDATTSAVPIIESSHKCMQMRLVGAMLMYLLSIGLRLPRVCPSLAGRSICRQSTR